MSQVTVTSTTAFDLGAWEQVTDRVWKNGELTVVRQYRPCQGGVVYATLDFAGQLMYFGSLAQAKAYAEGVARGQSLYTPHG